MDDLVCGRAGLWMRWSMDEMAWMSWFVDEMTKNPENNQKVQVGFVEFAGWIVVKCFYSFDGNDRLGMPVSI